MSNSNSHPQKHIFVFAGNLDNLFAQVKGNQFAQDTLEVAREVAQGIQVRSKVIRKLVATYEGEPSIAKAIADEVKGLIDDEEYLIQLHKELVEMGVNFSVNQSGGLNFCPYSDLMDKIDNDQ